MLQTEKYSLYEMQQLRKLKAWQKKMSLPPSAFNELSAKIQKKINSYIPEKIHGAITVIVKKMVETVLFASGFATPARTTGKTLEEVEDLVQRRLEWYRSTAALEGGAAGFVGFAGSVADFPALLAIKLKFLFDLAALYGHDTSQLKERVYLLYVFQLAFSNPVNRADVYTHVAFWSVDKQHIPDDIHTMNWRDFQQQYRDYLDLAKLAQMIPGIGAAVGLVVNYRLLNQLSRTAVMCYRMRWLSEKNRV